MRESFMKYDRDNPPAGVGPDGVFSGGGDTVHVIKVKANNSLVDAFRAVGFATVKEWLQAGEPVILLHVQNSVVKQYHVRWWFDKEIIFYLVSGGTTPQIQEITLKSDNTVNENIITLAVAT